MSAAITAVSCHIAVMQVTRKTNQELAVVDSSIWVSMVLLCAAVLVTYASIAHGKLNGLWVAGFFALCAFLFWRKEVVVFDSGRQQATWWRRRAFKVASGAVPFSDITGVGMEASAAGNNVLTYRLTLLTSGQPVPLSDVYRGDKERCDSVKAEILDFLHLDGGDTVSNSGVAHENSIQSLLRQGRRVDAIALVRASEHIGLTEAVDVVNRIDEKMKTAK
jgi:hypothetical protein